MGFIFRWKSLFYLLTLATLSLAAFGVWLLGSEDGRRWLTEEAITRINSDELRIELESLSTPTLGNWQIERLSVFRENTLWIDAHEVTLEWSPRALIRQALVVSRLSATQLHIFAVPLSDNNIEEDGDDASDMDFPALPRIEVETLSVSQFVLHGFIRGTDRPLRLGVDADFVIDKRIKLNAYVSDLDQQDTFLSVKTETQSKDTVEIIGHFQEVANGKLGKLFGLPQEQAIDVSYTVRIRVTNRGYDISLDPFAFVLDQKALLVKSQLELDYDFSQLQVDHMLVAVGESQHHISGSLSRERINVEVTLNAFPLDVLSPWVASLTGELDASLRLSGSVESPHVEGSVAVKGRFRELPLRIDAKGFADPTVVDIDESVVVISGGELRAKGRLDFSGEESDIVFDATAIDLSLLEMAITLPESFAGEIESAQGKLTGPLSAPRASVETKINGVYREQAFSLIGEAEVEDRIVRIRDVNVTANESESTVIGTVNIDNYDAQLDIKARDFPLDLLSLANINIPETLDAKLGADVLVNGNLLMPDIAGDAQMTGQYNNIDFSLNATGAYRAERIELDQLSVFAFDEEVLSAKGYYHNQVFLFESTIESLPTPLLGALGWYPSPGTFSARISASGTVASPVFEGRAFYETQINRRREGEEQTILFVTDINMSSDLATLRFDTTFRYGSDEPEPLSAVIPLQFYLEHFSGAPNASAFPLRGSVEADFRLENLIPLIDPAMQNTIGGNILGTLELDGDIDAPIINGDLKIAEGKFTHLESGAEIRDLNCDVSARDRILLSENCTASDGGDGRFSLDGTLTLPIESKGDVDMLLDMRRVNIIKRDNVDGEISGNVRVNGDFNRLLVSGNINVSPLEVSIDSGFGNDIPSINVTEYDAREDVGVPSPTQRSPSMMPEIVLDLIITADQQAYLRGRGLEAELSGKINIDGTAERLRYDGFFETRRGTLEVFGKKFDLQSGEVNFANNALSFRVIGLYEKSGQRIRAEVSGTDQKLNLELSAVPSMPQDEILAFIIFGKSLQTITPFEAVQLASAVQTLRGGESFFDPVGTARNILGVDTLSVESAEAGDGETGVNVGIGKYLNDSVYFELERTPNPSQPWKGNIEIELAPNLSLESSTGGQTGIEGAELLWKRDY